MERKLTRRQNQILEIWTFGSRSTRLPKKKKRRKRRREAAEAEGRGGTDFCTAAARLMIERSSDILSSFPPVEFAFTYGSGAVEQGGYSYKGKASDLPMIDFIFVVKDSEEWHRDNMELNPSHYSSLLPMNSKMVAYVQDKIPAHCWFNAYVPIAHGPQAGRMMKYGVISKKQVMRDLTTWNTLYIAGRLHKPVNIIQSNADIEDALAGNRNQALRTALLMLPETFTETELYMAIASLSYIGDPRMFFGENPKKVRSAIQLSVACFFLSFSVLALPLLPCVLLLLGTVLRFATWSLPSCQSTEHSISQASICCARSRRSRW